MERGEKAPTRRWERPHGCRSRRRLWPLLWQQQPVVPWPSVRGGGWGTNGFSKRRGRFEGGGLGVLIQHSNRIGAWRPMDVGSTTSSRGPGGYDGA